MIDSIASNTTYPIAKITEKPSPVRTLAETLEATFIAEMLKNAKLVEAQESFGGGIGEEQFTSFLRQAQADEMVKSGGVGLAENLFATLSGTNRQKS